MTCWRTHANWNWTRHGGSMKKSCLEAMEFTSDFHGFHGDLPIFCHSFHCFLDGFQFHATFMGQHGTLIVSMLSRCFSHGDWFVMPSSTSNFHASFMPDLHVRNCCFSELHFLPHCTTRSMSQKEGTFPFLWCSRHRNKRKQQQNR